MPPHETDAILHAAQRHAYASLVRTDGWRLYMGYLLKRLDTLKRRARNPENSDHLRSFFLGCEQQIEEIMAFVYKEADEENPLDIERKAILTRLAGMPSKVMPAEQGPHEDGRGRDVPAPPVRRSRRTYTGGVE